MGHMSLDSWERGPGLMGAFVKREERDRAEAAAHLIRRRVGQGNNHE